MLQITRKNNAKKVENIQEFGTVFLAKIDQQYAHGASRWCNKLKHQDQIL